MALRQAVRYTMTAEKMKQTKLNCAYSTRLRWKVVPALTSLAVQTVIHKNTYIVRATPQKGSWERMLAMPAWNCTRPPKARAPTATPNNPIARTSLRRRCDSSAMAIPYRCHRAPLLCEKLLKSGPR